MPNITDNTEQKRFEYVVDGHTAFAEYILNSKGMIFLTHTKVPQEIEGRGVAFEMIEKILLEIEERELDLVPLCPVVAAFIRRNPEWKWLLADNYNV